MRCHVLLLGAVLVAVGHELAREQHEVQGVVDRPSARGVEDVFARVDPDAAVACNGDQLAARPQDLRFHAKAHPVDLREKRLVVEDASDAGVVFDDLRERGDVVGERVRRLGAQLLCLQRPHA